MDVIPEKSVSTAIHYRRSVRVFKKGVLDDEKVKACVHLATLAPTSSNMQLWEFYHITSTEVLSKPSGACFNQSAAKTAQQMVAVVTRKDLWKKRLRSNIDFLKSHYGDKPNSAYTKREKFALNYYQKIVPTLYCDFIGILGALKYLSFKIIGVFRPIYRESRRSDMRIVAHKSAALAAENFMISMAAINYDTCPMEGFDSLRVKKILNLPQLSEINMIIACGLQDEKGVYGERFRVPFEEVYFKF
jgi:nitroreductase